MAIYLDYDQAALDRQYEHRNIVSDSEEFKARSRAESQRVRAAANGRFDVAYGDHADETLDIFFTGGDTETSSAPIIVFYHGGRWSMATRPATANAPKR